jgi:hypothetical protein
MVTGRHGDLIGELGGHACQMALDGLEDDLSSQTISRLVRATFGGESDDAQLAGVSASTPVRHWRRGRAPVAFSSSRAGAASQWPCVR